ncbi:hypothetical protein QJS04_geneDACA022420 [Acorus gramineus]|uniref:Uncharacterized protein n=1 Tax=Acorus gramineus TaxID=55184 RepID=A0AAV9B895_ACOGR|nr:hypothetical protein QJS04_geneDACA022420 [Acorus gramineus]
MARFVWVWWIAKADVTFDHRGRWSNVTSDHKAIRPDLWRWPDLSGVAKDEASVCSNQVSSEDNVEWHPQFRRGKNSWKIHGNHNRGDVGGDPSSVSTAPSALFPLSFK